MYRLPHIPSPLIRVASAYRTFFSIQEIEETPVLQWTFGAMLLFFFASFWAWMLSSPTTIESAQAGTAVCWPYFQDCAKLFFLHSLPYGYSQMVFYMGLFALILSTALMMGRKNWALAHLCLVIFLFWKIFVIFVLSYNISGVYDYYHVILTLVLLFVPHKEYFLKLTFVLLYFLSATTKFHQTWLLGTYFTTLKTGLPIFPDAITPLITNSVIFMQVVGSWFLLSRNTILQRLTFAYFVTFHLYSGIFVLYHYPTIALSSIIILFGPLYRYTPPPITWKKALPGGLLIMLLFLFQLPGYLIEGDQKLTLEGNRYGMYMFEANHQCIAHLRISTPRNNSQVVEQSSSLEPRARCQNFTCVTKSHTYADGAYKVTQEQWESPVAWSRCDPYDFWFQVRYRCVPPGTRISVQFDHSIDGGPFYRIVDEENICDLTFKPFEHNSWIRLPPDAVIVGYPVQNVFRYPI